MISLWTIIAVFLILIGVNICIFIGQKAYRTHVLLKNTVSYILLQYGVGVLVVYLLYLEVMNSFGFDVRPPITREVVLWSALTVTTACLSYIISRLALVPSDGMLYHIHNVLLHRIVDGTRPEAWRTTMRLFEIELAKATKCKEAGQMPKCLQYGSSSSSDLKRKSSGMCIGDSSSSMSQVVRRHNSASEEVLKLARSDATLKKSSFSVGEMIDSKVAMLMPVGYAIYDKVATTLPVILSAVVTALKHCWIRLSGIRISFGSVDEYYKEMNVDKRPRIPNRSVQPLITKARNNLNLDELCAADESSDTSLE